MQYTKVINDITIEGFDYSEEIIDKQLSFLNNNRPGRLHIAIYYPNGIVQLFDYRSCKFAHSSVGDTVYSSYMGRDVVVVEMLGDNSRMWLENP